MIVYVSATLLSVGLALAAAKAKIRWPWMIASALPLTVVAALRWGVGTDVYFTYWPAFTAVEWKIAGGGPELAEKLFRPVIDVVVGQKWVPEVFRIPDVSSLLVAQKCWRVVETLEPGYVWLMNAVAWCGGSFRWILAITSVLSGALVFSAVYRQSRAPAMAILFYVLTSNYFLSLNIVRQYIAIGFLLLAVGFAVDRRWWRAAACFAGGALFHKTIFVALPVFALPYLGIGWAWGFGAVALAFAASHVAVPFLVTVMPMIGYGHYVRYFGMGFANEGFEWIFFAINLCFMAMGVRYWRRASESCRFFRVWWWMTVLGTMALALSGTVPLMKRVNFYFAAPQFLMLPEMLAAEENPKLRRLFTVLAILAFAAETYVAVCLLNKNEPLPYRWCWR